MPTMIGERAMDALDAHLIACVLAEVCGPDGGGYTSQARNGEVRMHLDFGSCMFIACAEDGEDGGEDWLISAAGSLEEDVVQLVGEHWEDEAVLGVELLVALRSEDLPTLAGIAAQGELEFADEHPACVAARCLPLATLASLG